jgi:hypothetical protein
MTTLRPPPVTLLDKYHGRDIHMLYSATVTVSGGDADHEHASGIARADGGNPAIHLRLPNELSGRGGLRGLLSWRAESACGTSGHSDSGRFGGSHRRFWPRPDGRPVPPDRAYPYSIARCGGRRRRMNNIDFMAPCRQSRARTPKGIGKEGRTIEFERVICYFVQRHITLPDPDFHLRGMPFFRILIRGREGIQRIARVFWSNRKLQHPDDGGAMPQRSRPLSLVRAGVVSRS